MKKSSEKSVRSELRSRPAAARSPSTNEYYEALLVMRREFPQRFRTISPAARMALSYYERAKEREGNHDA